jgi:hypothetical protein
VTITRGNRRNKNSSFFLTMWQMFWGLLDNNIALLMCKDTDDIFSQYFLWCDGHFLQETCCEKTKLEDFINEFCFEPLVINDLPTGFT